MNIEAKLTSKLLKVMPFVLASIVVFGVFISVLFNNGIPTENVVISWFIVGAIYYLVFLWHRANQGVVYLWSAGTYTKKDNPLMFKISLCAYSIMAITTILIGVWRLINAS